MPMKLSYRMKSVVIQQWLARCPRDKIALITAVALVSINSMEYLIYKKERICDLLVLHGAVL
jgi:hypothetical protein